MKKQPQSDALMPDPKLKIESWPIEKVINYARNARLHSDDQVKAIAASIREYGFINPCLVDPDGVLIAGHGRVMACRSLGIDKIPVIKLGHLSKDQIKALRIADNQLPQLATWSPELLRAELLELKAVNYPIELIGFDDVQLVSFMAMPSGEDPERTPDPPSAPVSRRGDLWIMGKHRILAGDSTNAEDVERTLGGKKPNLMVTDPPYGVEYDADWRNQADRANGKAYGARAVGKVVNDDRADWRAAWELFNGDVAYVWTADLRSREAVESLESAGFAMRAQIIWVKDRFVISRGDYHFQHEPCQPAGTLVDKVVAAGAGSQTSIIRKVPIETLKNGDRVVSWNKTTVKTRGAKIKTASRHYEGDMHEVRADGCSTKATHSHHWTVRMSKKPMWVTYLMKRGDRWRVGLVQSFNSRGFGVTVRLKDEGGDAVWILGSHESSREARVHEQALSVRYGIPTTHWEIDRWSTKYNHRTIDDIDKIYELVGPLEAKAVLLLSRYGRHIDLPLATNEEIRGGKIFFSRKALTVVRSCNLIAGLMEIPKPTNSPRIGDPRGLGREGYKWVEITSVERQAFSGRVYSLGVAGDKHYISDGLITHNCWYAVRKGKKGCWSGDRSQTTVWQITHTKSETGHSTQKPIECMRRPIQNNSKPGDYVYEPFAGSGTTIIAAEMMNRYCLAIELSENYVDVCVQRWQTFTKGEATLEGDGRPFAEIAKERSKKKGPRKTPEAPPKKRDRQAPDTPQ